LLTLTFHQRTLEDFTARSGVLTGLSCSVGCPIFLYSLANFSRSGSLTTSVGLIRALFLFAFLPVGKFVKRIVSSFHKAPAIALLAFIAAIANSFAALGECFAPPHLPHLSKSIPVVSWNAVSGSTSFES